MSDDYLGINAANWDARADVHVGSGGYQLDRIADPDWISEVVSFDRARLGDISALDAVHLQCHIGTDTLSLARLGARMTGLDLSANSLTHARTIAERAGVQIDYRQGDVYSAPDVLGRERFDLVYTGIGALCWLPHIARWGRVVADLLRPGGRVFVRDAHPVLNTLMGVVVRDDHPDRAQNPQWISAPGTLTPSLELPYYEQTEPITWWAEVSYTGDGAVASPQSVEWNHGLAEIVMSVLDAGLTLELLVEHDSVPWDALPGLLTCDEHGEHRLLDRPERLPATFTLVARRPSS